MNQYVYNFTDHLGNVRLSYTDTNKDGIIQPRQYFSQTCDGPFIPPFQIPNCISTSMPGEIVEVNNYYPFGMMHNYTMTTQNAYQYKYNGKELQESGMYDYGARMYMPDLGRWGVIDPLAETSREWSTYAYAYNNPVMFIDPDGMQNVSASQREHDSALFWNFDQNTTLYGSSWFGSSYESAGFGGNLKTMWNGGDHGGGFGAIQGPKPNIFKSIGKFFKTLFRKSKKAILDVGPVEIATPYDAITNFSKDTAGFLDRYIRPTKSETFYSSSGGTNDPDKETLNKLRPRDKIEVSDMLQTIFMFYGRNTKLSGGSTGFQEALIQFGLDVEGIGNPFRKTNGLDSMTVKVTSLDSVNYTGFTREKDTTIFYNQNIQGGFDKAYKPVLDSSYNRSIRNFNNHVPKRYHIK